jgi:hypothetical protein
VQQGVRANLAMLSGALLIGEYGEILALVSQRAVMSKKQVMIRIDEAFEARLVDFMLAAVAGG